MMVLCQYKKRLMRDLLGGLSWGIREFIVGNKVFCRGH